MHKIIGPHRILVFLYPQSVLTDNDKKPPITELQKLHGHGYTCGTGTRAVTGLGKHREPSDEQ